MPAGAVTIQWVTPPSSLQKGIEQWGDKVITAVFSVAQFIATKAQNEMRLGAPWTDRTGNARAALFSVAEQAASDAVIIYLSHGSAIEYAKYLELGFGGKYAIIVPTLQRILPELERMLQGIFG